MAFVISAGSIAANATLGIAGFTANADKILERGLKLQNSMTGLATSIANAGRSFTILAIGGTLAFKKLATTFIQTASDFENYNVIMRSVAGSTEEATRMIKDLTRFAAETPFDLEEIILSGTRLAAVFHGNTDEVRRWLPALQELGALAKLNKINFSDMTNQFLRLITAGTGAADMFRERGILAILGITAEDNKDLAKMREKLYNTLTDVNGIFHGMANNLNATFTGIFSQIVDQWNIFKNEVSKSTGLFDDVKQSAQKFLVVISENRAAIVNYIGTHKEMVETIIVGTAVTLAAATAMTILGYTIPPMVASFNIFFGTIRLVNTVLKTFIVYLGVSDALAAPWAAAILAMGAALGVAFYALRAVNNYTRGLTNGFDLLKNVTYFLVGSLELLENKFAAILHPIDTVKLAVLETAHAFAELRLYAVSSLGSGFEASAEEARKSLNAIDTQITKTYDHIRGIGQKKKEGGEGGGFLSFLGHAFWEQVKTDAGSFFNLISSKVPGLDALRNKMSEIKMETTDWAKILGKPDFKLPGGVNTGADAAAKKAARELEALKEKGRGIAESLFPALQVIDDVTEKIEALNSIGMATPEAMTRIRDAIVENFKGTIGELDQAETALKAIGGTAAMAAENLVKLFSQKELEKATEEQADKLKESLDKIAQFSTSGAIESFIERIRDIQATMASLGQTMQESDLQRAIEEFATTIGVDTIDQINQLESKLKELGSSTTVVFDKMRQKLKDIKIKDTFDQLDKLGNAIGQLGPSFQKMASVAVAALHVIQAAMVATKLLSLDLLTVVIELIAALVSLGGSGKKHFSDMDRFLQDLGNTMDDVADRMTDAIVQFVRTGKAEIGDLVDYILSEFLRAGVSNLIVNPALRFVQHALFAKGAAFDNGNLIKAGKGHVTSGPELFRFRSGQVGVRGEAGTEAILPLARRNGVLGVQSSGSAPIVNVINNALPAESISVSHRNVDGQNIVDVVLDIVKVGLMDGSLSSAIRVAR